MSNNRGNVSLARKIALEDIAKDMEERLKKQANCFWLGINIITASKLRECTEITKLNRELGL